MTPRDPHAGNNLMETALRRLIVEFKPDGIQTRVLYRSQAGPNPGTARRRREAEQLVRRGLERTLTALQEGPVECIGTAGFETREDTLALEASPLLPNSSSNCMKRGA